MIESTNVSLNSNKLLLTDDLLLLFAELAFEALPTLILTPRFSKSALSKSLASWNISEQASQ